MLRHSDQLDIVSTTPSWYQFDNMLLSLAAIDGLEISEISCNQIMQKVQVLRAAV